ncbi:hypothetical protein [Nostoc phage YongM]|nr:hypothetical protein [Nostoc phage YongM]
MINRYTLTFFFVACFLIGLLAGRVTNEVPKVWSDFDIRLQQENE